MAALEHYGIAKGEVKLYDGSWTEYSGKQKEVSKWKYSGDGPGISSVFDIFLCIQYQQAIND